MEHVADATPDLSDRDRRRVVIASIDSIAGSIWDIADWVTEKRTVRYSDGTAYMLSPEEMDGCFIEAVGVLDHIRLSVKEERRLEGDQDQ